ncbi:MAG TPA: hypothetical protein VFF27_10195 [Bacteroidia bacterium]|jgi:hypothetical protein|nr:hypothetical protein [Bacteroidia bacterium]
MKKLILSIIVCQLSVLLHAQHDFRSGYVITTTNDTIKGLIDNNPDQENAVYCNFKNDPATSEIKTYTSHDLKEYAFTGGKHYYTKSIKFSNLLSPYAAPYFLERISTGVINLYYIKSLGFPYYFVEKINDPELYELTNDKITFIENGKTYATNSNKYKGVFSMVMNDDPSITKNIENTGFNRADFIDLLEKYHTHLNKKSEFTVYDSNNKKDKAKWKLRYGIAVGINYLYVKTNTYEAYDPYFLNDPFSIQIEYAKIVSSNMPSLTGNKNTYQSINACPGLFVNLNNNSKNSIQFELSFINKRFGHNDFLFSTTSFIAPLIYKREFRYYKKLKPFFDIGFCLHYEHAVVTRMKTVVDEPYMKNANNEVVYDRYSFTVSPKNSTITGLTYHYGFLGGLGCSYPLTKRNTLEFELRLDYTETQFNSFFGSITVLSKYRYINTGLITRISF